MKVAFFTNLKEDEPVDPEDPPGRWNNVDDHRTVIARLKSPQEYGGTAEYFPAKKNSISNQVNFSADFCINGDEDHSGFLPGLYIPLLLGILARYRFLYPLFVKKMGEGSLISINDATFIRNRMCGRTYIIPGE